MTKRFAVTLVVISIFTSLSTAAISWGSYGVSQTSSMDFWGLNRELVFTLVGLDMAERHKGCFNQLWLSFDVLQWKVPCSIFSPLSLAASYLMLRNLRFDQHRAFSYSALGTLFASLLLCFLQAGVRFGPLHDAASGYILMPDLVQAGSTAALMLVISSAFVLLVLTRKSMVDPAFALFIFLYASTTSLTFSMASLLKPFVQGFFELAL